jgi:hypothetical protein
MMNRVYRVSPMMPDRVKKLREEEIEKLEREMAQIRRAITLERIGMGLIEETVCLSGLTYISWPDSPLIKASPFGWGAAWARER